MKNYDYWQKVDKDALGDFVACRCASCWGAEYPNPVCKEFTAQREYGESGDWLMAERGGTDVDDDDDPGDIYDAMRRAIFGDDDDDDDDDIEHPAHYTQGEIECIDAISAALTDEEFRGYLKGNVLKYVWRERGKGGQTDLHKARWYLNRLLEVDA